MPSNHLILCHLLLLPPSIFPSIRVFSNELALCIRWPKYWSFSFSISSSNEHSGLISFRIDWFNLHAVQGTLKRLLQHYENISSSALSFLYGTTLISVPDYWKTIALTIWTFVGEVTTLLFITLSRFVTAFPPRGKRLLISWLLSPSAGILELRKISLSLFSLFPHLFVMKGWDLMP